MVLNRMTRYGLLVILCLGILTACAVETPSTTGASLDTEAVGSTTSGVSDEPESDAAYPGPEQNLAVDGEAYPGANGLGDSEGPSSLPETLVLPEPGSETGIVHGILEATNPANRLFLAGDVYLSEIVMMDGADIPVLSLDLDTAPVSTLRSQNMGFAILDVPPGTYGVVIHTPVGDYPVPDGEEGFLMIDVEAGEVIDLGIVHLE